MDQLRIQTLVLDIGGLPEWSIEFHGGREKWWGTCFVSTLHPPSSYPEFFSLSWQSRTFEIENLDRRRKLRKHKTFHYPFSSYSTPSKSFFSRHSHSFLPPFNGHGPAAIKIWGQICSARNNKSYLTRSICLEVAAWTGHSGQIWFRPIEKKIPVLKGRQNWRTGWQLR